MKKIYTCIDIASDTVRILVYEYFEKKYRTLAVSSVRSKGIKHGKIVDEDLLIQRLKLALDDIEKRIGIKVKKAIITIPAFDTEYSTSIEAPTIPHTDEILIMQPF